MRKQGFRIEALKLLQGLNLAVAGQAGTMARAPFSLYSRPTTKKVGSRTVNKYYVRFWNEATQSYDTAVSTGQTSKADAYAWAMAELGKNKKIEAGLTWRELCSGMFDQGSDFLEFYLPLKASFGEVHREHSAAHVERYILPVIGKMEVASTTVKTVQNLQQALLKRKLEVRLKAKVGRRQLLDRKKAEAKGTKPEPRTLSPSSVSKVISTFRLMVKWAIQNGHLSSDPFTGFQPVAVRSAPRGTLEAEEIRRLFDLGSEGWPDPRLRVLCLVAATSGLRSGELQGLLRECVQEISDSQGRPAGLLRVEKSWSQKGYLKAPKNGQTREGVVPHEVYRELKALMENSPYQVSGDFVFYQADRNEPVSAQMIWEHWTRALTAIGIGEAERKQRNIVFHSLRHSVNTHLINAGVPLLAVQKAIGHNSAAMSANYHHLTKDKAELLEATQTILEPKD